MCHKADQSPKLRDLRRPTFGNAIWSCKCPVPPATPGIRRFLSSFDDDVPKPCLLLALDEYRSRKGIEDTKQKYRNFSKPSGNW
jgi:hypothetical protein